MVKEKSFFLYIFPLHHPATGLGVNKIRNNHHPSSAIKASSSGIFLSNNTKLFSHESFPQYKISFYSLATPFCELRKSPRETCLLSPEECLPFVYNYATRPREMIKFMRRVIEQRIKTSETGSPDTFPSALRVSSAATRRNKLSFAKLTAGSLDINYQ